MSRRFVEIGEDPTPATNPVMDHTVSVLDRVNVTACTCGMQVFTRPGVSALFAAFVDAHAEEVAR